jgi:hypothetical protein
MVQDYQVECCVNQTACDAVSSRNKQDLIYSLVPPHYVCDKFI